jgi:hypothetical protein
VECAQAAIKNRAKHGLKKRVTTTGLKATAFLWTPSKQIQAQCGRQRRVLGGALGCQR